MGWMLDLWRKPPREKSINLINGPEYRDRNTTENNENEYKGATVSELNDINNEFSKYLDAEVAMDENDRTQSQENNAQIFYTKSYQNSNNNNNY